MLARGAELFDKVEARRFHWYNKNENETSLDVVESSAQGPNASEDPRRYYEQYRFSPFVPRAEVLKQIAARIRFAKNPPPPVRGSGGFPVPDFRTTRSISNATLHPRLEAERDQIDNVIVEIRHHVRLVQQMLEDVKGDPESPPIIRRTLIAVLGLFYSGVVYPLSFLPVALNSEPELSFSSVLPTIFSLRGAMLIVASSIFTAMCLVFLRVSDRLRYPEALLGELQNFEKVEAYSPYLEIMIANEHEEAKEQEANAPKKSEA